MSSEELLAEKFKKGRNLALKSRYELAKEILQEVLVSSRANKDQELECDVLMELSMIAYWQGRLAGYKELSTKLLAIAREVGYKTAEARALLSLGVCFREVRGTSEESLQYYEKSLVIYEELDDKRGIGACLNNTGLYYGYQGNFAREMDYYRQALQAYSQTQESDECRKYPELHGGSLSITRGI